MAEKLVVDPRGNIHLQFLDRTTYQSFCDMCVKTNTKAKIDPDTLRAIIARTAFEKFPKDFQDTFEIKDSDASKKILEARKNQLGRIRPAAPVSTQDQIDAEKFIDLFLPSALMPRVT